MSHSSHVCGMSRSVAADEIFGYSFCDHAEPPYPQHVMSTSRMSLKTSRNEHILGGRLSSPHLGHCDAVLAHLAVLIHKAIPAHQFSGGCMHSPALFFAPEPPATLDQVSFAPPPAASEVFAGDDGRLVPVGE